MSPPREPETPSVDPSATLQALAEPPRAASARTVALRYGLVRRPGRGVVAGICAALADAFGLPVRLVRAFGLALILLGPGLLAYAVLCLVLPRQVRDPQGGGEATLSYDIPARSLRRGSPHPGDIVAALGLLPAFALMVATLWLYVTTLQVALAFLVPVTVLLGGVLVLGGWKGSRARTTYLFAELGHRAGIVDHQSLLTTIAELRESAPQAWGVAGEASAGDSTATRSPLPALRWNVELRIAAAAILAGTILFSVVSYFPGIAPVLNPDGPMEVLARVGAAAALCAVLVGIVLLVVGYRGLRSPRLVAFGLACALVFSGSVVWMRLTDSRGTQPIEMAVSDYQPGVSVECADGGVREWNRPVIIDLSELGAPPSGPEARALWLESRPGSDLTLMDLSFTIVCSRPVGDVTVILPEGPWLLLPGITPVLGTSNAADLDVDPRWDQGRPSIQVIGELTFGDVTYVHSREEIVP